jgi:hypothetical protein
MGVVIAGYLALHQRGVTHAEAFTLRFHPNPTWGGVVSVALSVRRPCDRQLLLAKDRLPPGARTFLWRLPAQKPPPSPLRPRLVNTHNPEFCPPIRLLIRVR